MNKDLLEVSATYQLSNNHLLIIHDMDDDRLLTSIYNASNGRLEGIRWNKLDKGLTGFRKLGRYVPLNQCVKVGGYWGHDKSYLQGLIAGALDMPAPWEV